MVRKIIQGVEAACAWLKRNPSRMRTFTRGEANAGARAIPQNTAEDAAMGVRLDYGETIKDKDGKRYKIVNLQVNKNAADPHLKELAAENSHQVWGQARIPL